ncbi:MAG: YdcF family protein, partial [Thermodesulfobacteriota bacterium]|nr:YdcF family protein [Thermodesulfobacteriota bacterium]
EAAELVKMGFAKRVVINGDRKSDTLKYLEEKGFEKCCPWYEDLATILSILGISKDRIIWISAEDAYDTITESETVGAALIKRGFSRIIITTSKYHTRRAQYIWEKNFGGVFSICTVAAKKDPYDPQNWWKQKRQIRWVFTEYGAWMFLLLKS